MSSMFLVSELKTSSFNLKDLKAWRIVFYFEGKHVPTVVDLLRVSGV